MTEIVVAVIGLVQALMLALLAKIGRDTRTVRTEVKNDHTTNLREEQDERHHEQMGALRGLRRDIGRLDTRDIQRGIEIRDLSNKVYKHLEWSAEWSKEREADDRNADDRIGRLESTLNPRKDQS